MLKLDWEEGDFCTLGFTCTRFLIIHFNTVVSYYSSSHGRISSNTANGSVIRQKCIALWFQENEGIQSH